MLTWFEVIGYTVLLEPDIAPGSPKAERYSYTDVVLRDRLQQALSRINPNIPVQAIEEAICKVTCRESLSLEENNYRFYKLLTDGVTVSYQVNDRTISEKVQLIDLLNLLNNDWLAIHQFSVIEGENVHSPRVVVFINGLPLAVIESKNPGEGKTNLNEAYLQLQIYKKEIPTLFSYNQLLVISDGTQARVGTITSDWKQFMPWSTIDGEDFSLRWATELEVLIQGIFDKRRFLDLVRNFIWFEVDRATIRQQMLDSQQFYAVQNAFRRSASLSQQSSVAVMRSHFTYRQSDSHPEKREMCRLRLKTNSISREHFAVKKPLTRMLRDYSFLSFRVREKLSKKGSY